MQKKPTRIRTIRIPVKLDQHIIELAQRESRSVNYWIVNTLEKASEPK